ncbi:MAG TPA: diacylglycerol kinase family protein [Streptosporangiaceae bacterium]
MRGLLIVNPRATTAAEGAAELVTRSLAGVVDLDVEQTRHRGHARDLAAGAAASADLVLVLGGDGALNEAVNGVMAASASDPASGSGSVSGSVSGSASGGAAGRITGPGGAMGSRRPLIGVIPGGGGNVFARAMGLPVDPAGAVSRIRQAIEGERYRTIGLGLAGDRYFMFSADLGWDAEVVREVDRQREKGSRQSVSLYVRTIVREYYRGTDRRVPALTLERDGRPQAGELFMAIITNRSPWTYVGGRALLPVPNPDFNSGLDLLAMRRLRVGTVMQAVGQMLWVRSRPARGRHLLSEPGLEALTIRSARPIAFQVDGEYLGETRGVDFRFVPGALRVVA